MGKRKKEKQNGCLFDSVIYYPVLCFLFFSHSFFCRYRACCGIPLVSDFDRNPGPIKGK